MNKIILALLTFVIPVASVCGQDFIVEPAGTMIEGGRHYLKMKVWNCTKDNVEVPFADLPWGQYRLNLVLYPAGKLAGEPLKAINPIGDSPSTKIMIKAMSYVDGKVDLDYRFSNISRFDKGDNLLVFWAYDTSLIVGGKPQFVGGMIPLDEGVPSEGKAHTGCK